MRVCVCVQAKQSLRTALDLESNDVNASILLGVILRSQKHLEDSLSHLQVPIQLTSPATFRLTHLSSVAGLTQGRSQC